MHEISPEESVVATQFDVSWILGRVLETSFGDDFFKRFLMKF